MFTFSFGSAFATLSSDEMDALNQYKAEQAQNYYSTIEKAGENYLNGLTFDAKGNLVTSDSNTTGLISKEVVKAAVADAVDEAKIAFGQKVSTIMPDQAYEGTTITTNTDVLAALQKAYLKVVNAKLSDTNVLGTDLAKVVKKQFKLDKDAAVAALGAYDLSKYSDNIKDYAIAVDVAASPYPGAGYTYGDATGLAANTSVTAKEFVNRIVSTQTLAVTAAAETADGIKAVRKAAQIADELINGHKITTSENYYIEAVKTLDDLKADTSLESAKANAIAQINAALASKKIAMSNKIQDGIDELSKYANLSDSNKTLLEDLNEDKAGLDENFANELTFYTAKVNYQETTAAVKSYLQVVLNEIATYGNTTEGKVDARTEYIFEYADNAVDTVKKLEADAALLAQQKDVNGQLYYDKAVLDANLADAIKAVYMNNKSYDDAYNMLSGGNEAAVINAKIAYTNFITGEATNLQPKDSKGKTVTEKWNKATAASVDAAKGKVAVMKSGNDKAGYAVAPKKMYDKAQKEALKTLVADTKKAIADAKTVGEIEKIFAEANDKYEDIATTKDHKDAWAASGKVGLAYAKAEYDKELLAYAQYFVNKVDLSAYPNAVKTAPNVLDKVAYPIVYKAYTVDELAGKVADAKAAIDNILTKDAIKAKKAEVEAAIKALPATVALTDKDAITAAADALDDYNDIPGSEDNPVTNTGVLTAAEKAYEKLAAKELDNAYKALNAKKDITVADKEAIEALRALYDAYDDFVTDYYPGETPTATTTNGAVKALEQKLSDAKVAAAKELMIKLPANPTAKDKAQVEAARAAYEALTLEEKAQVVNTLAYKNLIDAEEALGLNVATSVKELKITARSSAKKGSITVKWTVKGDASAADGYQVWKSTKQSKGYKKAITTTKKSYKNTKGLKKGTRYYYKVRAYKVVDGKNVYSDWSNKAYRVAK